jgi:8-oxo-dGTP diphosphatase
MITIVAALVVRADGHVLLVRKRGTLAFMQPGGKIEPGESETAALRRELAEELGCAIVPGSVDRIGVFEAEAANEPGERLHATLYRVALAGEVAPAAEIAEIAWVDPAAPIVLPLAPLTRDHVLPLAGSVA